MRKALHTLGEWLALPALFGTLYALWVVLSAMEVMQ